MYTPEEMSQVENERAKRDSTATYGPAQHNTPPQREATEHKEELTARRSDVHASIIKRQRLFKLFFGVEHPKKTFHRTVDYLFEDDPTDTNLDVPSSDVLNLLGLRNDEETKSHLYSNAEVWSDLLFRNDLFLSCLTHCLDEFLDQFLSRFHSEEECSLVKTQLLKKCDRNGECKYLYHKRVWLRKVAGGFFQVKQGMYVEEHWRSALPFERIFLSLVLVDPCTMRGFSVGQEPNKGIGVSGIAVRNMRNSGFGLHRCQTVQNLNAELQKRDPRLCVTNLYQRGVVCWNLYPVEGASIEVAEDRCGTPYPRKVHQPQSSGGSFLYYLGDVWDEADCVLGWKKFTKATQF